MPVHDLYVEVFGGAGWVLFGKTPAKVEVFNDIDGELVNFFRVVKHQPEELLQSFELDVVSREEFNRIRNLPTEGLSDVERAHHFYYMIMAAWGGENGTPRFQTSLVDGGHGNRLIGALKNLRERIMPIHKRLQTVIIEHQTWQKCIELYDRSHTSERTLMYFDPPYPANKVNYRHNMRTIEEHRELLLVLARLKSRFVLSSYDVPEVHDLLDHPHFLVQKVSFAGGMPSGLKRYRNCEVIVTNYDPGDLKTII